MKKVYPTYKESDLPWVSNVPEHWQPIMNKYLFKLKKSEVGDKSGDFALLSLTLRGVIKRDMDNPKGKFPAEFNTYQKVRKGDLIFCLFDIEETPRTVGISPYDGMITGAYTVFESKPNLLNTFACYYYLFLDKKKSLSCFYRGLRKTISKETFSAIKLPLPTLPEQRQIAAYLDHKCALIDTFIAKKKRLIELLQEQKQAIINQAVTRGIDPDVPLKPSGVDWLGDIPAHWEVKKLKYCINILSGSTPSKDNIAYWQGTIPWASPKDIKRVELGSTIDTISELAIKETSIQLLPVGTVLIVVRGMILLHSIPTTITDIETTINQDLKALITRKDISPEFLNLYFRGKKDYFLTMVSESSHGTKKLETGVLLNSLVSTPSIAEQKLIVSKVKAELGIIKESIKVVEKELTLIQEYKTTLIAEAVTGKIDVRNWQAEQKSPTTSPQKQEAL